MSQLHKAFFILADYWLTLFSSLNFTSHWDFTVSTVITPIVPEYAVLFSIRCGDRVLFFLSHYIEV